MFLFTGDWHIGMKGWGLDRSREVDRSLSYIAEQGSLNKATYAVLLGDLFDSFRYPGKETLKFVSNQILKFVNIPTIKQVIIIKGNHDWADIGVMTALRNDDRVRIVQKPGLIELEDKDFPNLVCLPHLRSHMVGENGFLPDPGSKPFLVAAHMAVEKTVPQIDEPTVPREIFDNPFCLGGFCGHIHRHGLVDNILDNVYYTGSAVRITFTEEQEVPGAYIYNPETQGVIDIQPPAKELKTIDATDLSLDMSPEDIEARFNIKGVADSYIRVLTNANWNNDVKEKIEQKYNTQIVVTKNARPYQQEQFSQKALSLDLNDDKIKNIWGKYVETLSIEDSDKNVLKKTGEALLRGDIPEDIYRSFFPSVQESRDRDEQLTLDVESLAI